MPTPPPDLATVVWWRAAAQNLTVPRVHPIDWVDVTGAPRGRLEIRSHHLRIDQRTIETALLAELVPGSYPTAPAIVPAGVVDQQILSIEATLIIDGHHILERDLLTTYGLDIIAGISAQLLGSGPRAQIVLEETLNSPVREAAVLTAREVIRQFTTSTPSQLNAGGWTRQGEDRWQLLLRQR